MEKPTASSTSPLHLPCISPASHLHLTCISVASQVSSLVEKPTVDYARQNLVTPGLSSGTYLTAFGLYIILTDSTGMPPVHVCTCAPLMRTACATARARRYIITDSTKLFDLLEEMQKVREHVGPAAGLLQLTPALDLLRSDSGMQVRAWHARTCPRAYTRASS